MTSTNKRVVLVIGMHRSGTSALTRGLKSLGISLGENLMAPAKGINDKGFFEDNDIFNLNERILTMLNRRWYSIRSVSKKEMDLLIDSEFFHMAINAVKEKTDKINLFGLKDPRIARLLPFWISAFQEAGVKVDSVLVVRNPLSVAESLKKRDGFLPQRSHFLWLGHVLDSLVYERTTKTLRAVVDYDFVVNSPKLAFIGLAKILSIDFNERDLDVYCSDFLDAKLRHSNYDIDDLFRDKKCPQVVKEIYKKLNFLASEKMIFNSSEFENCSSVWENEWDNYNYLIRLIDDEFSLTLSERDNALSERDNALLKVELLNSQISSIYSSRSWKITSPMRYLASAMRRL